MRTAVNKQSVRFVATFACACSFLGGSLWLTEQARAEAGIGDDLPSASQRAGQLIEQLGDPSFIKRQEAKSELEKIGLVAFEQLRNAKNHVNVEIAKSAEYLLQSMRVVWTLPTDSFAVQQLLKDYNDFQDSQRLDRMQRLARLHRLDAYMGLLRLARFESNENLSKNAALHLMEAATDPKSSATELGLIDVIRTNVGESNRSSAVWLRRLLQDIDRHSMDLDGWRKIVLSEHKLLESNSDRTAQPTVKRMYRWIAKWLASEGRRDDALAFVEPSLDLLSSSQTSILDDLVWMLDEGLPEAVIRLFNQRPELFATRVQSRYLLAEGLLKSGNESEAKRVAAEASNLVRSGGVQRLNGKLDSEARQRLLLANFLELRRRYDWAEAELLRAEALHSTAGALSDEVELDVREALSSFYWEGDLPEKAAETWVPLMRRAGLLTDDDKDLEPNKERSVPGTDKELLGLLLEKSTEKMPAYTDYIPANYHFYRGLAAIQKGDRQKARDELRLAVRFYGQNPDYMIAMTQVADGDPEFQQELKAAIDALEQYYREDLAREESELAGAMTRQNRLSFEFNIATSCNQLAWLLSNTKRKPLEAISLSERSLALREDEETFIDTLARCHFSAGNLDKAIELQSKAVSLAPHERQLQRQLVEFQAVKAASNKSR